MAQQGIAEFGPSDGLSPLVMQKLNHNFQLLYGNDFDQTKINSNFFQSAQNITADVEAARTQAIAAAGRAGDAAEEAEDWRDKAKGFADDAEDYKDEAIRQAGLASDAKDEAIRAASSAQGSAASANAAARGALTELASVEDVLGTLNWITNHATFALTQDVAIDTSKVYYVVDSDSPYGYSPVTDPDVADIGSYYEMSLDAALSNYVASHLALTNDGLFLLQDGNGYRLKLNNHGWYIIDPYGVTVNQATADGIDVGPTSGDHMHIDSHSFGLFKNDDGLFTVRNNGSVTTLHAGSGDGSTTSYNHRFEINDANNDTVVSILYDDSYKQYGEDGWKFRPTTISSSSENYNVYQYGTLIYKATINISGGSTTSTVIDASSGNVKTGWTCRTYTVLTPTAVSEQTGTHPSLSEQMPNAGMDMWMSEDFVKLYTDCGMLDLTDTDVESSGGARHDKYIASNGSNIVSTGKMKAAASAWNRVAIIGFASGPIDVYGDCGFIIIGGSSDNNPTTAVFQVYRDSSSCKIIQIGKANVGGVTKIRLESLGSGNLYGVDIYCTSSSNTFNVSAIGQVAFYPVPDPISMGSFDQGSLTILEYPEVTAYQYHTSKTQFDFDKNVDVAGNVTATGTVQGATVRDSVGTLAALRESVSQKPNCRRELLNGAGQSGDSLSLPDAKKGVAFGFGGANSIYAFDPNRQSVIYTNAGTLSNYVEYTYSSSGGLTVTNKRGGASMSVIVFYWS